MTHTKILQHHSSSTFSSSAQVCFYKTGPNFTLKLPTLW